MKSLPQRLTLMWLLKREGAGEEEEAGAGELALCTIVYEKKKNFKPNVAKQKHLFWVVGT